MIMPLFHLYFLPTFVPMLGQCIQAVSPLKQLSKIQTLEQRLERDFFRSSII